MDYKSIRSCLLDHRDYILVDCSQLLIKGINDLVQVLLLHLLAVVQFPKIGGNLLKQNFYVL